MTITHRLLAGLGALALALTAAPAHATAVGGTSIDSPAAGHAPGTLRIPSPTGGFGVGVRSAFLADPARTEPRTGRPRTLPITIWYPTEKRARPGRSAPYLSATVEPVVEELLELPAGSLAADTHATTNAPARSSFRGVILMSAGLGLPGAFETGQVIDLSSRGWVVVTFDHPHDTIAVAQPGGTVITRDLPETPEGGEIAFAQRVLDTSLVVRQLGRLVPGWRPGTPTGMFGHSIGGAAAAEAVRLHPVLRAGVDLDGTPRGDVVQLGLDKPFGIMLSNVRLGLPPGADANLESLIAHLRGPHPSYQFTELGHDGFTDLAVFVPQALAADPALGAQLNALFDTQVETEAEGTAALRTQRHFLAGFFARYLP
jgi:pimeloyl-ACP methyl ester carboxylesterase